MTTHARAKLLDRSHSAGASVGELRRALDESEETRTSMPSGRDLDATSSGSDEADLRGGATQVDAGPGRAAPIPCTMLRRGACRRQL